MAHRYVNTSAMVYTGNTWTSNGSSGVTLEVAGNCSHPIGAMPGSQEYFIALWYILV